MTDDAATDDVVLTYAATAATQWSLTREVSQDIDAIVVPAYRDRISEAPSSAFLTACGFAAEAGQVAHLPGAVGEPVRIVLGLGPARELTDDAVRRASAGLARAVRGFRRLAVVTPAPDDKSATAGTVRAFVEGFMLGGYRFTRYKTGPAARQSAPAAVELVLPEAQAATDEPALRAALRAARRIGEGVLLARDLVNEPGGELTPRLFAERAAAVAESSGLRYEIWDERRIADERLGGLTAVGRSSPRPPRLVRLTYRPRHKRSQEAEANALRTVALVGKGVTFDAGGISLKASAEMATMKADMAGAAAVLGAMSTLAALDCPVRVDGWLPLSENMPNADPVRIGDVLRMRGGRTVEVRNADAEGRLIMADALTLAVESAPDAIVDLATLTDAAAIALGRKIAPVMGTDAALTDRILRASRRAGEALWPLPLPDRYRPQLESQVADLVNYTIGTRHGTALLAGLFLREFVTTGVPWAHLDIQGTALCDADDGEWVVGGTGFGVRTLVELLCGEQDPASR